MSVLCDIEIRNIPKVLICYYIFRNDIKSRHVHIRTTYTHTFTCVCVCLIEINVLVLYTVMAEMKNNKVNRADVSSTLLDH